MVRITPSTAVKRAARFTPSTVNEAERTIDMVVATEAPIEGIVLSCRQLPEYGPAPVPVLLSHQNDAAQMAGRLENLRIEGRKLIGTARFIDAPAADAGWQLARSGCAVSVGASIGAASIESFSRDADMATGWRLREASLVPVPADPDCLTRSENLAAGTAPVQPMTTEIQPSPSINEPEITRAEAVRQNAIRRQAQLAGLDASETDALIATGQTPLEVGQTIIRKLATAQAATARAGHPARAGNDQPASGTGIADVLAAKFGVKGADPELRHVSLARAMEPLAGGAGIALDRMSAARIIERAYSTSDFSTALLASGERMVLQGYNDAPRGVRALAMARPLADFRAVTMLRLSKFGSLAKKLEGGEYSATTWSEEDAAVLRADEYGRIAILTRKAVINDDLDIFGRLLSEMGASAARLEAELLAAQLLGAGFTWGAGNSTTGDGIAGALEAGTLKLRRQTDVGGNRVSFEPSVLLVPPELEAEGRQVLSDRYMPNASSGVNPFPNIQLEVDPQLTAVDVCYLADGNYAPLALGTIGAPATTTEEHFETGNRKLRVQHDAAAAVNDQRSIVKITVS